MHLCTINGVCRKYYRVKKWFWSHGELRMLRDGKWETITLERRHVGAYAVAQP